MLIALSICPHQNTAPSTILNYFTLNITRADMVRAGYSPVCACLKPPLVQLPIISDYWQGIETIFEIGKEILIADSSDEVLRYLREMPETERRAIGQNARTRVLAEHTAAHRAAQLEQYVLELIA
jgi:spore maturation protein CgeB